MILDELSKDREVTLAHRESEYRQTKAELEVLSDEA